MEVVQSKANLLCPKKKLLEVDNVFLQVVKQTAIVCKFSQNTEVWCNSACSIELDNMAMT